MHVIVEWHWQVLYAKIETLIVLIQICIVVCVVIRVTLTGSPTGWQGAERVSGDKWLMDRLRQTDRDGVAPDILWNLFISFSPPHTKSFYISTFLHLKSSWSRCFFFAKIYYLGKVPTKCRPSGRCFGLNLFEIFREKIRYFENFDQWSKYCRCRMGDHEVRVFAHHWKKLSKRHPSRRKKLSQETP